MLESKNNKLLRLVVVLFASLITYNCTKTEDNTTTSDYNANNVCNQLDVVKADISLNDSLGTKKEFNSCKITTNVSPTNQATFF